MWWSRTPGAVALAAVGILTLSLTGGSRAAAEVEAPAADVGAVVAEGLAEATDLAQSRGDDLGIVYLDRVTKQFIGNVAVDKTYLSASLTKLFIADQLLYESGRGGAVMLDRDRNNLSTMIAASDDALANHYWAFGGKLLVERALARYNLSHSAAHDLWYAVALSPYDMALYYDQLLSRAGGLSETDTNLILNAMAVATDFGAGDGEFQQFGLRAALTGAGPIKVKQGWMPMQNSDYVRNSTGILGGDRSVLVEFVLIDHDGLKGTSADDRATEYLTTALPDGGAVLARH
jgi:hypothetical protein